MTVNEMLVYTDEEEEPKPSYTPIYPVPGTDAPTKKRSLG